MFLIADAYAQTAGAAPQGSVWTSMLPFLLMFVVLWFMMIRPQMKRTKEHKKMLESLKEGSEVMTQSGVAGKIVKISPDFISLEVAENTTILVQKGSIANLLPPDTLRRER